MATTDHDPLAKHTALAARDAASPLTAAPDDGTAAPGDAVLVAHQLGFDHPGFTVFDRLDLRLTPGLSLVRGGDGRGKTTLLRVLAGEWAPTRGQLQGEASSTFLAHPADAVHDRTVAADWLGAQAARWPRWNAALADALVDAFALSEHRAKQMHMLSTGTRRKVGLVAAAASGARLTMLDMPYAAIDADSAQVLSDLLREAASDGHRAWLVADHAPPKRLAGVRWAAQIDLGD